MNEAVHLYIETLFVKSYEIIEIGKGVLEETHYIF